jgi:hypothetical protein
VPLSSQAAAQGKGQLAARREQLKLAGAVLLGVMVLFASLNVD